MFGKLRFTATSTVLIAAASALALMNSTQAEAVVSSTTLTADQSLLPSASLVSGPYTLVMQSDGNLVEYSAGVALWASGTAGYPGAHLVMQSDGNAVVYSSTNYPLWLTATAGLGAAAYFTLQADGNIVLYGPSGARWFSGVPEVQPVAGTGALLVGQSLGSLGSTATLASASQEFQLINFGSEIQVGQHPDRQVGRGSGFMTWAAGDALDAEAPGGAKLTMQNDGNLVLYSQSGRVRWQTHTNGSGTQNRLVMQDDGNLVMYTSTNRVVWASTSGPCLLLPGSTLAPGASLRAQSGEGLPFASLVMQTDGNLVMYYGSSVVWSTHTFQAGSHLILQTDGNLVIYSAAGSVVWSSGTPGHPSVQYLALGPVRDLQLYAGNTQYWERGA